MLPRISPLWFVALVLAFVSPNLQADTIPTTSAVAERELTIYVGHDVASPVAAKVAGRAQLVLETGPHGPENDWWYGKVRGTEISGWFQKQGIRRNEKEIPAGNRWIDVTIDDKNGRYVARLMVGTTIVDEMKPGVGALASPTPGGTYQVIYRQPNLFELPAHPGLYLQWWQTFRYDGPDAGGAWGLHTWVLDAQGFPTSMGQYGRVSSGCTRLPRAMDVFKFLGLLSTVNIHYSPWRGATTSYLMAAKVAASGEANVRSAPSTAGKLLGTVGTGQVYVTDEQSMGWWKIRFGAREGWIWAGNLATTSAATVRVKSARVVVREGEGVKSKAIGEALAGYRYGVADRTKSWTQVWWRGRKGWINSDGVVRVAL